jgi:N-acetylglutamate synthase-like GNAT family acetyltransferase
MNINKKGISTLAAALLVAGVVASITYIALKRNGLKIGTNITTKRLTPTEYAQAQEFYTSVGYEKPIKPEHKIIAAFDGRKIVALGRLEPTEGTLVLGGMQVAPDYQRGGVGTLILKELDNLIGDKTCWLLTNEHLENFYAKVGFKKIDKNFAPTFLQKQLEYYLKKYPHLIVMVKNFKEIM